MTAPEPNAGEAGSPSSDARVRGSDSPAADDERGRSAEHPADIPRKGWRDILLRVAHRISEDNVTLVSAGIAFNAMFAIFPALIVLVSIYGLFSSPAEVGAQVKPFFAMLPAGAAKLIQTELYSLASRASSTLTIGAAVSFAITLWSAIQGMSALMIATNIAYHEPEKRGFFKLLGLALAFTLGALAAFLVLLGLGIAVPIVLAILPLGPIAIQIALAIRWVLLWLFAVLALSVVYRFAPCREDARWQWVNWGSVVAASLWLGGSILFALYVQNFGSYGKTYGTLGGAMVMLMWFYLGSFAVVLGAELNAEMEHQTKKDTTTGPPQPMGKRGAYVADTVGATPGRSRNESPKSASPSSAR